MSFEVILMSVGRRIRKIRKGKKWTLEDLKSKTGLSISFLSDIEREVSNPSLKRLKIIAESLDVSVSYLLEETSPDSTENSYYIPIIYSLNNKDSLLSEENIKNYYRVNLKNKKNGEYFMIEMQDDSMEGSAIVPGSLLLIRRQEQINNGDIAAFISYNTDSNNIMIRKIYISGENLVLQPENHKYDTKIYPHSKVKILGKVISTRYDFE